MSDDDVVVIADGPLQDDCEIQWVPVAGRPAIVFFPRSWVVTMVESS